MYTHPDHVASSAGHQLHYDSDDEGQGGVRNPIFTSILYLAPNTASPSSNSSSTTHTHPPTEAADSSNHAEQQQDQPSFIGGPTLVTDQLLGGPLATKGWLAYPATNRFVMFDGKYLHGKYLRWPCRNALHLCHDLQEVHSASG
jgi:hypothetical protein